MPLLGFMKCCALTEEESHRNVLGPSHPMTLSVPDEITPTTISRTGMPPRKESVQLPTPDEAKKINQEMLQAMDNYRKRIHAQHIHHFLRFSMKPKRRPTLTQGTMTHPSEPRTKRRSIPEVLKKESIKLHKEISERCFETVTEGMTKPRLPRTPGSLRNVHGSAGSTKIRTRGKPEICSSESSVDKITRAGFRKQLGNSVG